MEAIIEYEKSLTTKYKKENGIFYTDIDLAKCMLSDLKLDKEAVIFDPCCGMGSFLLAATKLQFSNVYGCDMDGNAIKNIKLLLDDKIVVKQLDSINRPGSSTLSDLNIEKVDCIIGNPPYAPIIEGHTLLCDDYYFFNMVKNNGNNLFIGGLLRGLEMLKKDGILSYIIPKNFLHVDLYKEIRKRIIKNYSIMSIVDLGMHFKNVRGEQVILTVKNSCPIDGKIIFKKYNGKKFIKMSSVAQSFFDDRIIIFDSIDDFKIYKHIKKSYITLKDFVKIPIHRGRGADIKGNDIRKYGYKNNQIINYGNKIFAQNIYSAESGIIATLGGDYFGSETLTVIEDGDTDNCKIILALLHSRFFNYFLVKYVYNNSRLTMHTDGKYLYQIPFPQLNDSLSKMIIKNVDIIMNVEYMSDEYKKYDQLLNEIIYKCYGFNENEVNCIEKSIRLIQSRRWFE